MLKEEIKKLIVKCYLFLFLKRDSHPKPNREEPNQSIQTLPEINVILEGTSTANDSCIEKRNYGK
jgi:hypothetical protein